MILSWLSFAVAILAGGIAAISGFGIGSLLTPTLSWRVGTKLAVAAVTIPHFAGTGVRLWLVRKHVDRRVLRSFGITSAAGGLCGAVLHAWAVSRVLGYVFAGLLIFAGISGLTGLAERIRLGRRSAWAAGALSGLLGGLVGNQGGIRSAAMLGIHVARDAFVATATAIGLLVDLARLPVYLVAEGRDMGGLWPTVLIMSAGVVVGTLVGRRALAYIPERIFKRVVAAIILALGVYMLWRPGS